MASRLKAVLLSTAMVSVTLSGCSSVGTLAWPFGHHSTQLTGARLSALMPTPAGFTLSRSASSDSGATAVTPTPGSSSTSGISCASWWSGHGYFGPGTVAYTIRNYSGPDGITLHIGVNVYPKGTGAGVYAMSVGLQRRCLHFSYLDKDGVHYVVSARIGPSAEVGDRSQEVDATETAPDGTAFTTQSTFISVGDALVAVTETGSSGAPVRRAALPLSSIASRIRAAAAGY